MEYTLTEAERQINKSGQTIQNYLENTEIHTKDEISKYIKSVNKSGKRMITELGLQKAINHYGLRQELIDSNNIDFLQSLIIDLKRDKEVLYNQLKLTENSLQSEKFIGENASEHVRELQNEQKELLEIIHKQEIENLELEHRLEAKENRSLIQRILNK